jgi:phage host-nuclease inhibitor protein Gam
VLQIGQIERELGAIELELKAEIARLKEDAAKRRKPLEERHEALVDGVTAYAESHRDELTQGGKTKTYRLPSGGELKWRLTPPALLVSSKPATVIRNLKRLGLRRFVRFKPEINKEALTERPDVVQRVPGISIVQREEFFIKPPKA